MPPAEGMHVPMVLLHSLLFTCVQEARYKIPLRPKVGVGIQIVPPLPHKKGSNISSIHFCVIAHSLNAVAKHTVERRPIQKHLEHFVMGFLGDAIGFSIDGSHNHPEDKC